MADTKSRLNIDNGLAKASQDTAKEVRQVIAKLFRRYPAGFFVRRSNGERIEFFRESFEAFLAR